MVRSGLRYGSLSVSGFHEILRGLWALKFHRVPQVLQRFHTGSTNLHNVPPRVPEMLSKVPWFALEGSIVSCARRLKSHRIKIGRNTKQNRNQWRKTHFHCFVTCSLAQANVGFVANQITSLRDSRCSRVNAWHCCLVGFALQQFHEAARARR